MADRGLAFAAGRGGAYTLLGQFARITAQGLSVVILARLLEPRDYGLLAMVVAVVAVGDVIRDFGLSFAAIQSPTLSPAERSNLFWVNATFGLVLAVVVFFGSTPLAAIYDEPSVEGIGRTLALVYLVNGVMTQYQASLTRAMRFRVLALVEGSAPFAGLAVGASLALGGAGYWALVWQQVATQLVLLILYFGASRWVPIRYSRSVSIRRFIRYGADVLGVQLLTYASRNIDAFVLGARFGPSVVGPYNMAFQIMVMPLNQLNAPATKVALPTLAKLHSDETEYSRYLVRGQAIMINSVVPVLALIAVLAPQVVPIALGDQWEAAVPLLRILALGGIAQVVSYATYWVFLSRALTRSNLRYALLTRVLLVVLVIVGSQWGATGVAVAYSGSLLAFWPLGVWWISRHPGVPARAMLMNGARALLVHGVSASVAWIAVSFLSLSGSPAAWTQLVLGVLGYFTAWGCVAIAWPPARRDVQTIYRVAIGLVRR